MYFQNRFFNGIAKLYEWFTSIFSNIQSVFIFLLRITWGHQFFVGGLGKLQNIDRIVNFFTNLGIPAPTFHAYAVSSIEFIGGFLLIIGLASRLSAFALSIIMLVAYSTAHVHIFSFALIKNPVALVREEPFAYLMMCLIVLFFGPGKIAIDGWIKRWAKNRQNFYGP